MSEGTRGLIPPDCLGDVERLADPPPDAFARFVHAHRPVVITGAISSWPAFARWTPEYLASRFGDREVTVVHIDSSDMTAGTYSLVRFGEFLAKGERSSYLAAEAISIGRGAVLRGASARLAELGEDCAVPRLAERTKLERVNFWMGHGRTRVALHFDPSENLLAVVRGTKSLRLFPPSETRNVYPRPLRSPPAQLNYSSVRDAENPDLAAFPRFRDARWLRCELAPGDMLFLPAGWWHYVVSEGQHIAVNFWWSMPLSNFLRAPHRRLLFRYGRQLPAIARGALRKVWT